MMNFNVVCYDLQNLTTYTSKLYEKKKYMSSQFFPSINASVFNVVFSNLLSLRWEYQLSVETTTVSARYLSFLTFSPRKLSRHFFPDVHVY